MRDLIRRFPAILLGLGLSVGASGAFATTVPNLVEVPYLKPAVKAGKIPPIEERVPEDVDVFDMKAWGKMPGKYGGQLKFLMGKQKDTKMMMVYGYARLIAYDHKLNFVPDILKRFEVKEQREFTFYLRKGHKWSDGHPFTAEDFRYYWEEMANNKEIARKGLPTALLVNGEGLFSRFLMKRRSVIPGRNPIRTLFHGLRGRGRFSCIAPLIT